MSLFRPTFTKWRHGGWYVSNLRYPSGASGCVSNNYPDKKWRIVCDDRRRSLDEHGDITFKTRRAAAQAEFVLCEQLRQQTGPTPRQLEAAMPFGCSTPEQLQRLYTVRKECIDDLKKVGYVTLSDLERLDRIGRFQVANDCWHLCTQKARKALLEDQHHQVRSTAALSHNETLASA